MSHSENNTAENSKPDILFIMPDQMRGDCLSLLSHPVVNTPNFDRMAKEGICFCNAFSPVASCIPARYALLSGMNPGSSGVVGYATKPFSEKPFPELLTEIGYETILVGRNMHQAEECGDCGYQKAIYGSTYVKGDEYDEFLKESTEGIEGIKEFVAELGLSFNHWQAAPWPLEDEKHPTDWIVARSLDMLNDASEESPLFLTASFYAPHPPLFPPKKYFDKYYNADLPPVACGEWVNLEELSTEGNKNGQRIILEGEKLRRAQAGYFGLIEHLDDRIGQLVDNFRKRSESAGRPWVVLMTTDHGEMLGDHGYFRKCEPFQGSAYIPFIFCGSPDLGLGKGKTVKDAVCLQDVMPTLLNLAGADIPAYADGENLVSIMKGEKKSLTRKYIHFEHAPCYSQEQGFQALTDGVFKYIWRSLNGREHLFNLAEDPDELHDLSQNKKYEKKLNLWRTRLIECLKDRPENFVQNNELVTGQEYIPINNGIN